MKTAYSEQNLHLVPSCYGPFTQVLGGFIFYVSIVNKIPIVTASHSQNLQYFNMSVPELPPNTSSQEETFKDSLEKLYLTKSKEIIQTMLNYLFRTRCQQNPIVTMKPAQYFHIFKRSVPELPSNISSQDRTFESSLEQLYPTKSQERI